MCDSTTTDIVSGEITHSPAHGISSNRTACGKVKGETRTALSKTQPLRRKQHGEVQCVSTRGFSHLCLVCLLFKEDCQERSQAGPGTEAALTHGKVKAQSLRPQSFVGLRATQPAQAQGVPESRTETNRRHVLAQVPPSQRGLQRDPPSGSSSL